MVNLKRLVTIAGILLVASIGVVCTMVFIWDRNASQPSYDASKLPEALAAFSRELRAKGQPLPPTVSLQELVAGGYLRPEDVPTEARHIAIILDQAQFRQAVLQEQPTNGPPSVGLAPNTNKVH